MGGELKDEKGGQKRKRLGEEDTAQKNEKIGDLHGIAGDTVDALLADAALRGGREADDGEQEKEQAECVEGRSAPEEGGGRSMDRREEGAQQQGGAGELIELVGRLFGPAERGEVGSPPECAAVQHGEHSEAQAQKWNQQNGRHDMSSLCHDNPL